MAKAKYSIEEIVQELFPLPRDLESYISTQQVVPGNSVVTITWHTREHYDFYIRRVYADLAANCSYLWTFTYAYFCDGATKVVPGNAHEFTRRIILKGGEDIVLTITNTGVADQTVDIILDMWVRSAQEHTIEE